MKTYKVIALSVGGLGNKIYNSKDIVTEANFPEGNAEKLVKSGFLEPIKEEKKSKKEAEKEAEELAKLEAEIKAEEEGNK